MTQQESVETKSYATTLVILKNKRKVHLIEIDGQYFSLEALVKDLVEMEK